MTLPDDQKSSFGVYLQACRQAQGISLQVLSIYLRISVDMLTAIEKEDYSQIPEPVYAKGFLRAFAKSVGADGDFVVENYVAGLDTFQRLAQAERKIEEENQRFGQRVGMALGVLLMVIVLTVLLARNEKESLQGGAAKQTPSIETTAPSVTVLQMPGHQPGKTPTATPEKASAQSSGQPPDQAIARETGQTAGHTVTRPPVATPTCSALPLPDDTSASTQETVALWLKVDALEETWLKIIIDNQKPSEYTLQPGDHLGLGATSRFNLLIGNATGVGLSVNDRVVPVPGERGQVVTIDIP